MSQGRETLVIGARYEVLDTIGQGAAANVYRVRDRADGTIKAVKLLRSESVASEEIVRRFEDEFRILRGLHHPSLPEVFDYGWTEDDSRYMAMEFVEGQRLDQYLSNNPDDLWVVLYELCEVFTFIHSHSLLHLDTKPANILVKRTAAFGDEMPLVVLIDFGLTHRRGAGETVNMVGTPEYMAPEIIRGEAPFTSAVDYYSLGVSLYQLITGDVPFRGSARDVFAGHLGQEPRFEREKIEYAELYPHVRGLMSKDKRQRLEAFEDFKRTVIARMTGGIRELEKAYGLARINSLGMIGKDEVWKKLMEWVDGEGGKQRPPTILLSGESGSGKTHVMDRFVSEMSIRGSSALPLSRIPVKEHVHTLATADRNMVIWDALCAEPRQQGVVVVVDALEDLDDSDRELLSYLKSRYELAVSSDSIPRVRFLLASDIPGAGQRFDHLLPGEERADLVIWPLTTEDHLSVTSVFRGNMVSAADAQDLSHFLGHIGHTAGAIRDGLRNALLDGALTFIAGRWQSQFTDYVPSTGSAAYYNALISTFSPQAREVTFTAACHSGPVTAEMVSLIAEIDQDVARREYHRLRELGLVRRSDGSDPVEFSFVSEVVRNELYRAVPSSARQRIHSRFRKLIETKLEQAVDEQQRITWTGQLSAHLEGLGDYRGALQLQLRVLHHHAMVRDLIRVRKSVQWGYRLCEQRGMSTDRRTAEAYRRYLTRVLLRCEWEETNYHRVREIVESAYPSLNIPVSFVPKYVRSLQASGANEEAKAVVERCMSRIVYPKSITILQMKVELALVLRQMGEVQEAISVLENVTEQFDRMDVYYRCRAYLHLALCYETLGDFGRVLELVTIAEEYALAANLTYEIALIYQFRSAALLDQQDIPGAKSAIAMAVRLGGKKHLHNIMRGALFQASAIYFGVGDYERCEKYLGKATLLAERLGDSRSSLTYVIRSAIIQHALGLCGNASRFLDRAEKLLRTASSGNDEMMLRLVRWDIAIELNMDDVDRVGARANALMKGQVKPHRVGYYHLLYGRYHELRNQHEEARKNYLLAWRAYEDGGIEDDAARAATALARVAIAQGDEGEYGRLSEILSELMNKHPVPDVLVEVSQTELRHAMAFWKGDDDLLRAAMRCEVDRKAVNTVAVLIGVEEDLFSSWRRLGRNEDARKAFERFHRCVKKVVANIPERAVANRFLARPDIALTLRTYKSFSEGGSG